MQNTDPPTFARLDHALSAGTVLREGTRKPPPAAYTIESKLQILVALLDPEATPDADLPKGRIETSLRLAREALALATQAAGSR